MLKRMLLIVCMSSSLVLAACGKGDDAPPAPAVAAAAVCPAGQVNSAYGCIPTSPYCGPNQGLYNNTCVQATSSTTCTNPNEIFNPATGTCVPNTSYPGGGYPGGYPNAGTPMCYANGYCCYANGYCFRAW